MITAFIGRRAEVPLKTTCSEQAAEPLGAVSFCTEDYLLGAVGGAARGCELFTEDYLLGAVSGAAGSCGRKTGSVGEQSLLRAVLFESRGRRNHFRYENPAKPATSFSPFFLLPPALVAPGRSAHRSQPVVLSTKARSHELLRPPLPAGLPQ